MCLDFRAKKRFKYNKENGYFVGWKKFTLGDSAGLHFTNQGIETRVPVNRWIHEKDYRRCKDIKTIEYGKNKQYRTGFHIFVDIPSNIYYTIELRKVYFRDITTHGYEAMERVVVAKEMFILPVRGKPKCA